MLKTHHKFRYVVLAVFVLLVFVLIAFIRHMENLVPVAGYFNDADLYVEDDTLSSEFDHVETDILTMDIPKGWELQTTGRDANQIISVRNPDDDRYAIFLQLQSKPVMRSYDERNIYQRYANVDQEKYGIYSYAPVIRVPKVESFYGVFNEYTENIQTYSEEFADFHFPQLRHFVASDTAKNTTSLSQKAKDDSTLRATFSTKKQDAKDSDKGEGVFTGTLISYEPSDVTGYYVVYATAFITTPQDHLLQDAPALIASLKTLSFKSDFSDGVAQNEIWDDEAGDVNSFIQAAAANIENAWQNREAEYDIARQKWADEHYGFERVYDTETQKVYRAFKGFEVGYQGNRYRAATDKEYAVPISGYLNKA